MSLETWNTFDNLPNLSAGQKALVIYQGGFMSALLIDLCIEKYGETNVIIESHSAIEHLLKFQIDDDTYEIYINNTYKELEKYNCQKIIVSRKDLPSHRKSAANLNVIDFLYKTVVKQIVGTITPETYDYIINDVKVIMPVSIEFRISNQVSYEAAAQGISPQLFMELNPNHEIHQILSDSRCDILAATPSDRNPARSVDAFVYPDYLYDESNVSRGSAYELFNDDYFPFGNLFPVEIAQLAVKLGKQEILESTWNCVDAEYGTIRCGTCNRCTLFSSVMNNL